MLCENDCGRPVGEWVNRKRARKYCSDACYQESAKRWQAEYKRQNRERLAVMEKERYQREKAQRLRKAWNDRVARYGLTPEDYAHLFYIEQKEKCAACGSDDPRGGKWHIDHCHETGVVRGILCMKCNHALGNVEDSIDVLLDLANYLCKA